MVAARELAGQEGVSIGATVSDLARQGWPRRSPRRWSAGPSSTTESSTLGLLEVNVLVALVWEAHVHHRTAVGLVRPAIGSVGDVSGHRGWLHPGFDQSGDVLWQLRSTGDHHFVANDVSLLEADVPTISGHRQVTDPMLLTVALPLVTFDGARAELGADDVEHVAGGAAPERFQDVDDSQQARWP